MTYPTNFTTLTIKTPILYKYKSTLFNLPGIASTFIPKEVKQNYVVYLNLLLLNVNEYLLVILKYYQLLVSVNLLLKNLNTQRFHITFNNIII